MFVYKFASVYTSLPPLLTITATLQLHVLLLKGKLYSNFSFGEVYRQIYDRKIFMAMREVIPILMHFDSLQVVALQAA